MSAVSSFQTNMPTKQSGNKKISNALKMVKRQNEPILAT